jgi:hypothetical protein
LLEVVYRCSVEADGDLALELFDVGVQIDTISSVQAIVDPLR